jgi:hypothetical protein
MPSGARAPFMPIDVMTDGFSVPQAIIIKPNANNTLTIPAHTKTRFMKETPLCFYLYLNIPAVKMAITNYRQFLCYHKYLRLFNILKTPWARQHLKEFLPRNRKSRRNSSTKPCFLFLFRLCCKFSLQSMPLL